MEMHDRLYALGLQAGRGLFDDPDGLGNALAAGGAPPAETELVVDAVRRGAFRSMIASLDAGTDPTQALQAAGGQLGAQRGTDPNGAAWALSVLGFAVGRLGENDVRAYRAAAPVGPPGIGQAPTVMPGAPPAYAPPAYAPPAYAAPVAPPATPAYGVPQPPAYGQQPSLTGWPQQPPAARSKTPLVLAGVGTLAAVVVAVVLALVLTRGSSDDDTSTASADVSTSAPTTGATEATEPTSEATSEVTEPVEPAGDVISDEDYAAYGAALVTFSQDFSKAGDKLSKATSNDNTAGAKAAARDMRTAVYNLDMATRALDLSPVQEEENAYLTESGTMISQLDALDQSATSALDVSLGVGSLPIQAYTGSFETLANAIDANRAGN